MDRQTIYYGQVPLETDLLNAEQMGMVALAKLSAGVLGTNTFVNGFTCTPTTPASLNVVLNAGEVYQLENLEATGWSSLPANTLSTILKQGIQLQPVTFGITPPGTTGFSQVYLVEVQYQDLDSGLVTLPYFNSANPASPFMGPGNSGQAQNTVRQGIVASQLKAGIAASTGTQVAPTPDAGWTGLFYVTIANGASTVTAGNITTLSNAPFLAPNGYLPQIPTGVQDSTWTYAVDTGGSGPPIATTSSTATSSAVLNFSGGVPAYVQVGMKAYDLTTPAAITGGQTVLSKTGTSVTLTANVNATVNSSDQITFSNNAYGASIVPVPTAVVAGQSVEVKIASTNTGPATFNLNNLGAVAIHRANGFALSAGDLQAGQVANLYFDGTAWQISNYFGVASTTSTVNNFTTVNIPAAIDSGTVNNVIASFSPAITSLSFGTFVLVKFANTNTGPVQITVNALAAVSIYHVDQTPLLAGDMVAGEVGVLAYDGTGFQLVNHLPTTPTIPIGNPTLYVRTDGNDNNNGLTNSPSGAFATIQAALNHAQNIWVLQGKTLTIQLGIAGTYAPFQVGASQGSIIILGSTSSPNTFIIQGTSPNSSAFCYVSGASVTLRGLRFNNSSTTINIVQTTANGSVFLDTVTLAQTSGNNAFAPMLSSPGGAITIIGPVTVIGNFASCINCSGGIFQNAIAAITLSGTPVFSQATAVCAYAGTLVFSNAGVMSGSASGLRYNANLNGVINTNTGNINFFPGTSAGITASGGQYA